MKKLVIFGTSTMAQIAHFFFSQQNQYEIVGFTVNRSHLTVEEFCGLKVFDFETIEDSHPPAEFEMFVALGPTEMNSLREHKFFESKEKGYTLASFVSETARCNSLIGENTFIGDFVSIQPFVELGENIFAWEYALIANDVVVGSHCYLAPRANVGTFARVENNCVLGTGSIINTRVKVANHSLIGASCYISTDTRPFGVYGERQSAFLGAVSMKIDIARRGLVDGE